MNLGEAFIVEVFAEEASNGVLKLEDGLICLCLQIDSVTNRRTEVIKHKLEGQLYGCSSECPVTLY